MFLDLVDLDPKFICTDPDPVLSINKQTKIKKNLDFSCFGLLYDFLSLKNDVNVPSKRKKPWRLEGR
jgi:hypothetical protein